MISGILKGSLGLISLFYPKAAGIVSIIEKAAPYIEKAMPIIQSGIKEGAGVLAAVQETAPELTQHIKALTSQVMASNAGNKFGSTPEAIEENLTRQLFGFRQMTFEEEMHWMNSTTPHNDPSQENSIYGSA